MDIYNEQSFPIVEFAFDLIQWQAKRAIERTFQFNSMESDQEGLIYIRPEGTGFILGSACQRRECVEVLSENIIDGFISKFCEEVGNRTPALVGYDALKYLCGESPN
jgi:myo-inositol-hexaphosphate 3-phosphohydrolase